MRRAVPLLLLAATFVALAGCVRDRTKSASGPAADECFDKRDQLQALAQYDPKDAKKLAEVETRCNERANALLVRAMQRFEARDAAGGRALLDRAIALASPASSEFARADELRKQLDRDVRVDRDYLREGREAEASLDWAAAREAYRAAIDAGKTLPGLRERLTAAELECQRAARRALAEARAFETARDLDGALDAVDRALAYLDDPQSPEYLEAEEAQQRIEIAIEREEDDGIDPPGEDDDGTVDPADMAAAEEAEHRLDWIAARNAYRALVDEYPDDRRARDNWTRTQEECLVVARREIIMAKAYEAAQNFGEAAKSLASALRCADSPHLPEYTEARRLLERIRSQNLPAPSLLTLPTDRDELLRFGDARSQAQDWVTAREAFRRAAETAPADEDVKERVAQVEAECRRQARRYVSEAKAYEAAANYREALNAARTALLYADSPDTKENQLAREIERRIQVEMTYP